MSVLEMDQVTKRFGHGSLAVTAVESVDLNVDQGDLVVIMGPSGSGKSTLLQLVGALLTPTTGDVRINGQSLSDRNPRQLADIRLNQIGFIFQTFNLLSSLSATENVALPASLAGVPRGARSARSRELLVGLGLGHRLAHTPEQLSGGEKQRVAIARALVNDPPLLLADEPTANLDSASGYQVLHVLEEIAASEGKTVIMVTHDHRVTDVADRVLWLADGRLAARELAFDMATDPVCGMEIVIDKAAGVRVVRSATYYLCSQLCVDKFDTNPDPYLPSEVLNP